MRLKGKTALVTAAGRSAAASLGRAVTPSLRAQARRVIASSG